MARSRTSKKAKRAVHTIWMVAREYAGIAEAGGVKDVVRQLAEALAQAGKKVTVILPCYGFMDPGALGFIPLQLEDNQPLQLAVDMDYAGEERRERVGYQVGTINRVRLILCQADRFTEKHGVYSYTRRDCDANPLHVPGQGHYDYFATNVLLQKAALELMPAEGTPPDIIHCHDGHAALLPAMARECAGFRSFLRQTGCVVTIHNAGAGYHQEVADLPFARAITALPRQVIDQNLLHNAFDPLLAASSYAVLNTVSENYARELMETDADKRTGWLGRALVQRGVHLHGITNGIDPTPHDPARPKTPGVVQPFDPVNGDLTGKAACRAALIKAINSNTLAAGISSHGSVIISHKAPLFIFIGRLTHQKGVDILCQAMEQVLHQTEPCGFVILGQGDTTLEENIAHLADRHAGRIAFLSGHSSETANRVLAAGDFIIIPSRFEPCGLTDFQGQLMGALPIVHNIGGLVKVIDNETGLVFERLSKKTLLDALTRAIFLYQNHPEDYRRMQRQAAHGVHAHHTWKQVRKQYLALYRLAAKKQKQGRIQTPE